MSISRRSTSESSSSASYAPSHHNLINMPLIQDSSGNLGLELAISKQEAARLKETVHFLEKKVALLEGKLETYDTLLERVSTLVTTTNHTGDAFLELIKQAREEDAKLPGSKSDNYCGTFYWTREEWMNEYQSGRGVLSVNKGNSPGSALYIVGVDGLVASEQLQARMSWQKASTLACEYVYLRMCLEFVEFRLCNNNWKTDVFATRHYPQWRDRPGGRKMSGDSSRIKEEDVVQSDTLVIPGPTRPSQPPSAPKLATVPPTVQSSNTFRLPAFSPPPTSSKHVHSVTVSPGFIPSPSARVTKKMKEDVPDHSNIKDSEINTMDMGDTPLLPPISFPPSFIKEPEVVAALNVEHDAMPSAHSAGPPKLKIKLSNPLSSLWKGKNASPGQLLTSRIGGNSTSTSAASSTTDLANHMANASVQDANNIIIPPTVGGRVAFLQNLTKSLHAGATNAVAQATAKKNAKANTPAHQAASRTTAKNLCRTEWTAANLTSSSRQFDNYWKKLPAEQKEKYNQRLKLIKMAKNTSYGKTVLASSSTCPSQATAEEPVRVDDAHNEDHPMLAGI
ncbi:hypothetical protein PAXINDRAFT_15541 [Paxillus involutus ATCC 200175]|uniref:Uncharacterized protein n=1 Tax=Paxillus involutus ATCC 200175 TaxID=664439 RepID=A0A0C9TUW2_PAXIN|nr:hypothetical protein PAXINDRAFT_15541 [Paxillus involutus ATCC 200175]